MEVAKVRTPAFSWASKSFFASFDYSFSTVVCSPFAHAHQLAPSAASTKVTRAKTLPNLFCILSGAVKEAGYYGGVLGGIVQAIGILIYYNEFPEKDLSLVNMLIFLSAGESGSTDIRPIP